MHSGVLSSAFAVALSLAAASPLLATPIATYSGTGALAGLADSPTAISVRVSIGGLFEGCDQLGHCAEIALGEGISTVEDQWSTTLTAADPRFAAAAALLTNGIPNLITLGVVGGDSYDDPGGALAFWDSDFSHAATDLEAQAIERIVFSIDWMVTHNAHGPAGRGPELLLGFTLSAFGPLGLPPLDGPANDPLGLPNAEPGPSAAIPEPPTWLLGSPLVAFYLSRRLIR
jgi:hypothetical protein